MLFQNIDLRVLILIIIRVTSFISVSQVFFPKGTHNLFKIAFSIMFSFVLFPVVAQTISIEILNAVHYIVLVFSEFLIGILIGIFANLLFNMFSGIGSILDSQGGFSSSQILDPLLNENTSLIERFFYWISLTTFIIFNGHYYFVRAIIFSYEKINIGELKFLDGFVNSFVETILIIFKSAFMIIIPIVIILIFIDIILGIISRIIPKINMIVVSFPFKIIVTIALLIVSVKFIFGRFLSLYADFNELIFKLLSFAPILFVCSDDKTEEPTPHKLKKTREGGNVAKSQFLVSAISFIGIIVIILVGGLILNELKNIMIYFFRDGISYNYSVYDVINICRFISGKVLILVVVPGIIFIVLAVISNIIQTGFLVTPKALKPNFKAFNVVNNVKNIFNIKALFELVRDLLVVIILCYISYDFIASNLQEFFRISNLRVNYSFSSMVPLLISIFSKIFMVIAIIGVIDFGIEKFRYKKKLKMTKQEVKEEFKQMEGDPEVKAQIKQKGKQIIMQNIRSNIKNSSVVITNPTHISVVLKYKQSEDSVPKLTAKGVDHMAFKIREIAQELDIPIIENKMLARFIYKNVELNQEIPQEIYKAVADILTYIYRFNNKR